MNSLIIHDILPYIHHLASSILRPAAIMLKAIFSQNFVAKFTLVCGRSSKFVFHSVINTKIWKPEILLSWITQVLSSNFNEHSSGERVLPNTKIVLKFHTIFNLCQFMRISISYEFMWCYSFYSMINANALGFDFHKMRLIHFVCKLEQNYIFIQHEPMSNVIYRYNQTQPCQWKCFFCYRRFFRFLFKCVAY